MLDSTQQDIALAVKTLRDGTDAPPSPREAPSATSPAPAPAPASAGEPRLSWPQQQNDSWAHEITVRPPPPSSLIQESAETTTSAAGSFRVAHGRPQSWGPEYLQEPALGALELLSWRLDRSGRSFARAPRTRGAAGAAGRACAGVLQVALVEWRGSSHCGALVCCARSIIIRSTFAPWQHSRPPAASTRRPLSSAGHHHLGPRLRGLGGL